MNSRLLRHCLVLMIVFMCCTLFSSRSRADQPESHPSSPPPSDTLQITPLKTCKSALLMEASSGEILFEMNSHDQLPPASMVKMMLLLLVMEKIQSEELSYDELITTSAAASRIGGSQVYLKQGEQFPVKDLIKTVLIQSANDSCYAIAEHIAGSVQGFIDMMNDKAKQLGMSNTRYTSVHGLPPGKGEEPDLSTAHDLAILAREIVTQHPEILQWSSLDTEPFRDGQFLMTNTNRLVRQMEGCDGLKTGYYREAGFCVTATAKQNGVRTIAVIMGCEKGKERFAEASRLMKLGFSLYKEMELIAPEIAVNKSIPIADGQKLETYPVVQTGIRAVIRKNRVDDIIMKTTLENELTAPVQPGTVCGSINFFLDDRELGSSPLITAETIERLSWWGKFKRVVGF